MRPSWLKIKCSRRDEWGSFVRLRFEKGKQNIHSILLFSDKSFFSFFRSTQLSSSFTETLVGVRWNFFMHWQIDRKVFIFLLLETMLMKMMKWRFGAHLQFALSHFLFPSNFNNRTLCWESIIDNNENLLLLLPLVMRTDASFCYKIKLNKWWQSCIYSSVEWIEIGMEA